MTKKSNTKVGLFKYPLNKCLDRIFTLHFFKNKYSRISSHNETHRTILKKN